MRHLVAMLPPMVCSLLHMTKRHWIASGALAQEADRDNDEALTKVFLRFCMLFKRTTLAPKKPTHESMSQDDM